MQLLCYLAMIGAINAGRPGEPDPPNPADVTQTKGPPCTAYDKATMTFEEMTKIVEDAEAGTDIFDGYTYEQKK